MATSKDIFAGWAFAPRVFAPGAFRGLGVEVVVLNEFYDVAIATQRLTNCTITKQRVTNCAITQQRVTDCTITTTG